MKKLLTLSLLYLLAGCKGSKMAQPALPAAQKMSCDSLADKYCAAQVKCNDGGVVKLSQADCVKAYKLSYCSTQASCSKKGANYDSVTQCKTELTRVADQGCGTDDPKKVADACAAACVPALAPKRVEQMPKPAVAESPLPGKWRKDDDNWPVVDLDLQTDGRFSWTEENSLSDGGDYEGCVLTEKYNGLYFVGGGGEMSMYSLGGTLTVTDCDNEALNVEAPIAVNLAMLDRFDAEHIGQSSVADDTLTLSFEVADYVMSRQ